MTAKIVFSSNKSRANFPVSVGEAEGPGPWDGDGHQDEAEQGDVFEEVDLLVHFRLRILDRPEIVNAERGAQQENRQQKRSDGRVIAQEHARSAQQEKHATAANGQRRSGHALTLGVSGHHVELGQVVEAAHEEKTANDDASDKKRDSKNTGHESSFFSFDGCGCVPGGDYTPQRTNAIEIFARGARKA